MSFPGASWCVRVRGLDKPNLNDGRGLNSGCVRFCPGGVAARLLHQEPPPETRTVYAPGCTLQHCHILCIKGNLIQRSASLFDTCTCCAEGLCARGSGQDVEQATDRLYAGSCIQSSENFPSGTWVNREANSRPAKAGATMLRESTAYWMNSLTTLAVSSGTSSVGNWLAASKRRT
jgi:hypothetical protein